MVALPKPLTLEAFLELPEEEPALEFQDGTVVQKVSPKGQHSVLQTEIWLIFDRFARPRRLGRAFTELRATFAGASRVPDVAFYLTDRIPRNADGQVANDFYDPPDIAVEIVSPEQSVTALVRRCLWYVANGTKVALLVDPDDKSILLFRPNEIPRALRESDQVELGEILPGFELSVSDVFAALQVE